jgi:tubulin-folding cofactor B
MPDEVYEAREGTYRKYKQEQARLNPQKEKTTADYPHIVVGARCLIEAGHRGEVGFFGAVKDKTGLFVGIQLDDPFGKNDGTVGGERYFPCLPKCGVFVRPEKVQVGDFPPDDGLSDDEI